LKKIAITQSNYIPWKGYFDLLASVDEIILYDDVQFTKRDWRNRNQIKTPNGKLWLTVPVKTKNNYYQKINETLIDNETKWAQSHWKTIFLNYSKAPYFKEIESWLKPIYIDLNIDNLSLLNQCLIKAVCKYLKIETKILSSSEFIINGNKSEKLLNICKAREANEYISGPAAKNYLDLDIFIAQNIKVTWFNYSNYHKYPQLWNDFYHDVSILDLLFNCGPDSYIYMKYVNKNE
jgi:hypothetical protein